MHDKLLENKSYLNWTRKKLIKKNYVARGERAFIITMLKTTYI